MCWGTKCGVCSSAGAAAATQPNTTTVLELAYLGMPTNYNAAVFWVSDWGALALGAW